MWRKKRETMSTTNYQSMRIDAAPTADELQAMRDAAEAPRASVQVNTGGGGRVTFRNGQEIVETDAGTQRLEIAAPLRPGHVLINGVETTVAGAKAAGLLPEDYQEGTPRHPQDAARSPAGSSNDGDKAEESNTPDADTPAAIKAASDILNRAVEGHGVDVVESTLMATAETGELPETLPEGVTADDAKAVYDGYVAQAEATLAEVGASVPMLDEMLTDEELKAARQATFFRDHGRLQALGQEAQRRLELLPMNDPDLHRELVGTLPQEWREKVAKDQNGNWSIDLGKPYGRMSWGTAVRAGFIRF
jgi:hypothetical protein